MLPSIYSPVLNGFLLSILLIVVLKAVATQLRLVDLPDARKRHSGAVPLCGGLAIFVAFIFGGLGLDQNSWLPWNWAAGFLILVLIGAADDRWRLNPLPRLAVQSVGAAVLMSGYAGVLIVGAGTGTGWYLAGAPFVAIALLFIVGTANAVNMLDGADGLAGATVAVALFWLALIGLHVGDRQVALHALVLAAAVIGFLMFNMRHPWRPAASIFMGDAGSMLLGGALAVFVLQLSCGSQSVPPVPFVVMLWVIVVPICDTLSLIIRRASVGRSPLSSDRWHLHHLLLDCGVPPAAVAPIIAGISGLCGAVSYYGIILHVPDIYLMLGLLIPLLAHTVFVLATQDRVGAVRASSKSLETRPYREDTIARRTNEVVG